MAAHPRNQCDNLALAGFDTATAAQETWEALLSAGACQEGDYILASGAEATIKVNAEVFETKPLQRETVMGHVATFPCVMAANVLLYVPDGMRNFTNELGEMLEKPVAQAKRPPGSTVKYDFMFTSLRDQDLALSAEELAVLEDVVTTLGSVAALATLLDPRHQNIHSLAFLLRGAVNRKYRAGLTDHYLVQRPIPLDKDEFRRQLNPRELRLYEAGLKAA